MQPPKPIKRFLKILYNLIALLLAITIMILVGATQTQSVSRQFSSTTFTQTRVFTSSCLLNDSFAGGFRPSGLCAYSYVLGGIGSFLSIIIIVLTIVAFATGSDAPVGVDASLHAFLFVWWLIGTIVLGVFIARANEANLPQEGPRVAIIFLVTGNFLIYLLSLWTNACCCIARNKNETISMYV